MLAWRRHRKAARWRQARPGTIPAALAPGVGHSANHPARLVENHDLEAFVDNLQVKWSATLSLFLVRAFIVGLYPKRAQLAWEIRLQMVQRSEEHTSELQS